MSGESKHLSSPSAFARRSDVGAYRQLIEPTVPVLEESITQLKPGPTSIDVAIAQLDSVSILRARILSPSVGVTILKPSAFAFLLWVGTDACRINGQRAQASKVYMPGAQQGFHICGGQRETIGVAVSRRQLIETVAALQGVHAEDVVLDAHALELPPAVAAQLRRGVSRILEQGSASLDRGRSHACAPRQPSEVFRWFLDALLYSQPPTPKRARSPERIVRKAEERFFDAGEHRISLADLCTAANVSQATLYRAFQEVCGEAPLGYFRKRRMLKARSSLIDARRERGAVKRAALCSGMTALGRFSVEYRQLFGESPSATLCGEPPG